MGKKIKQKDKESQKPEERNSREGETERFTKERKRSRCGGVFTPTIMHRMQRLRWGRRESGMDERKSKGREKVR